MTSTLSKETVEAAATLLTQARALGVRSFKLADFEVHFDVGQEEPGASVSRNPFAPVIGPGAPAANNNPLDDPEAYFNMRAAIANVVAGSGGRE